MGTMTLEEFRSELLFDLRNRTDVTTPDGMDTTRQDRWINQGYLHITHPTVFRHRELQTTQLIAVIVGTGAYTYSPLAGVTVTGIRYVSHVAATTDDLTAIHTKMLPRDEQWFESRAHNSSGRPRDYCTRGDQILISPIPDATQTSTSLVMGAFREPALLTAGQTTAIANRFDEILVLAARWRAELHLGYRDLAAATKIDMVSLLNEYKSHEDLQGEDWDWQTEVVTETIMETV